MKPPAVNNDWDERSSATEALPGHSSDVFESFFERGVDAVWLLDPRAQAALERMHWIHQLIQNKEYPNCTKLAKEFEVAKRTMKRDIEFMKDRMNLPIGFDVQRNGYFYTEKVDRFPELPMSEAEVFALFVASKTIEQYRGTPFRRLLETAFRQLTGRLDENVKFSMGSLDNVISFRPFAPGDADVQAFETLSKGVRERWAVKFMYRNHAALSFQRRHVHPYHMAHAMPSAAPPNHIAGIMVVRFHPGYTPQTTPLRMQGGSFSSRRACEETLLQKMKPQRVPKGKSGHCTGSRVKSRR